MVYLISEETLKKEGLLDPNLFGGYITPAIKLAQDKGLQQTIGGPLYEKICDLVSDGTINDEKNFNYKFLLDEFVIPYLLWQTMAECAVPISWKFKNQGLVEANTDWNTRPSMKDFQYVVQKFENDATFYKNRLYDYLCANSHEYPEFHKHVCGKLTAENKDFGYGLYLGYGKHHCSIRNDEP